MRFSQNLARNVKILLTIFFKVIIIALFLDGKSKRKEKFPLCAVCDPLAQLVEQFPFKEWAVGSNPTRVTINKHNSGPFI